MKSTVEEVRIVLTRFFVVLLMAPLTVTASAWEGRWVLAGTLFFIGGLLLIAVATVGRLWCSLYIGGRKSRTVVTQGPYSICRNPLYFFNFMGALGVGLTTRTLLVPLGVSVAFALYYPWVIVDEEKKMRERFGDAFVRYMAETPRFWPRLGRLSEPEEYPARPIVFRTHMVNVLGFILVAAGFELIRGLQACGILPVWFHLI